MTQLTMKTARFGEIAFEDADVVKFPDGVLGFPSSQRYVLIQHKEGSPFRWMQSVDEGFLAFLVVDPGVYLADYAPEMPSSIAQSLALQAETPRLVYTIVTIPPGKVEDMTLNLAGPIVINVDLGLGKQIVLDDATYPVKHRVFALGKGTNQAA
jgi:flagellar assembly factor FliW